MKNHALEILCILAVNEETYSDFLSNGGVKVLCSSVGKRVSLEALAVLTSSHAEVATNENICLAIQKSSCHNNF